MTINKAFHNYMATVEQQVPVSMEQRRLLEKGFYAGAASMMKMWIETSELETDQLRIDAIQDIHDELAERQHYVNISS